MEPFPLVVNTLDTLHLATAAVCAANIEGNPVALFSHDQAMNRLAKAMGLLAPLSDRGSAWVLQTASGEKDRVLPSESFTRRTNFGKIGQNSL